MLAAEHLFRLLTICCALASGVLVVFLAVMAQRGAVKESLDVLVYLPTRAIPHDDAGRNKQRRESLQEFYSVFLRRSALALLLAAFGSVIIAVSFVGLLRLSGS